MNLVSTFIWLQYVRLPVVAFTLQPWLFENPSQKQTHNHGWKGSRFYGLAAPFYTSGVACIARCAHSDRSDFDVFDARYNTCTTFGFYLTCRTIIDNYVHYANSGIHVQHAQFRGAKVNIGRPSDKKAVGL